MYDVKEFRFDQEKCWFKAVCTQYKTDTCNCGCSLYCQFYYLVNLANIPVKLQYTENQKLTAGEDLSKYQYLKSVKDNIENWVNEGGNLYLYSKYYGNGKTTWAVKLMCSYFVKIWNGNGTKCRGLFINIDDFLMSKKSSINKYNNRLLEIEKLIPEVDLVIWDDIGCNKLSDYDHSILFPLLNSRITNGKANIFTSNVIDSELVTNIGGRLASRVLETSQVVEFNNPPQRRVEVK